MIYALTAFALACLTLCIVLLRDYERLRGQRNAMEREARQWAKLYWDLRDDTPARGSDGKVIRRGK